MPQQNNTLNHYGVLIFGCQALWCLNPTVTPNGIDGNAMRLSLPDDSGRGAGHRFDIRFHFVRASHTSNYDVTHIRGGFLTHAHVTILDAATTRPML